MSKNKFKITKKILAKEENQIDSRFYEIISKNVQIRMLGDDRNDLFKMLLQLQSQLDHQKSMWQELKEWLKKAILRNKDNIISKYDYENVLVIMQELEGEDENTRK